MYPEPTDSRPPLLYRETVHRPFETPGTLAGASAPQGERWNLRAARKLYNSVDQGERCWVAGAGCHQFNCAPL